MQKKQDILFNASKTHCIFFPSHPDAQPGKRLSFMNDNIEYLSSCTFLGITISNSDVSDRHILQSVRRFYCKSNEVLYDFKTLI